MTDEEINRKFGVVAGHLATLAVGMQQLQEAQIKSEKRLAKSEQRLDRLETVLKLTIRAGRRERADLHEKINALVDAQMKSEERITSLAETVERYLTKGENGNGHGNK